jgi:hypothetical protein
MVRQAGCCAREHGDAAGCCAREHGEAGRARPDAVRASMARQAARMLCAGSPRLLDAGCCAAQLDDVLAAREVVQKQRAAAGEEGCIQLHTAG